MSDDLKISEPKKYEGSTHTRRSPRVIRLQSACNKLSPGECVEVSGVTRAHILYCLNIFSRGTFKTHNTDTDGVFLVVRMTK